MPFEEQPIPAELLKEQETVQSKKLTSRTLYEYNEYLFHERDGGEYRVTEVEKLVNNEFNRKIENINDLILAIYRRNGRIVHWADMGGGHALAQRQVAGGQLSRNVSCTNVDLFERNDDEIRPDEAEYIAKYYGYTLTPDNKPNFIKANVENVKLPNSADIITSIESLQYLNNPLLAICNWYNQLSQNGLVFVSTETNWSPWIRSDNRQNPLMPFLQQLEAAKILFSYSSSSYTRRHSKEERLQEGLCTLVIKKREGTTIKLLSTVDKVWANDKHQKAVYYKPHPKVIEIVRS